MTFTFQICVPVNHLRTVAFACRVHWLPAPVTLGLFLPYSFIIKCLNDSCVNIRYSTVISVHSMFWTVVISWANAACITLICSIVGTTGTIVN